MKRKIAITLLLSFTVLMLCNPLYAQRKYPEREIEMVIPWNPGGVSDIAGRVFANELGKVLKVPVVPVNKVGAAGTLGATFVHNAKKDGYTILFSSVGYLIGSTIVGNLPFDPLKDFTPLAMVCDCNYSIFVKGDSAFKNFDDFMEKAKKNPKLVSIGVGLQGDTHLNVELLQKAAGVQFNIVPFKGGGEAATAVLGGHLDACLGITTTPLQYLKAGEVRILVQTGEKRSKYIPDVPTFKEKGINQAFIDRNWNGLFVSARVPKEAVDALTSASEKTVRSKELIAGMDKVAYTVDPMSDAAFRKKVEADYRLAEGIVKQLGMREK